MSRSQRTHYWPEVPLTQCAIVEIMQKCDLSAVTLRDCIDWMKFMDDLIAVEHHKSNGYDFSFASPSGQLILDQAFQFPWIFFSSSERLRLQKWFSREENKNMFGCQSLHSKNDKWFGSTQMNLHVKLCATIVCDWWPCLKCSVRESHEWEMKRRFLLPSIQFWCSGSWHWPLTCSTQNPIIHLHGPLFTNLPSFSKLHRFVWCRWRW